MVVVDTWGQVVGVLGAQRLSAKSRARGDSPPERQRENKARPLESRDWWVGVRGLTSRVKRAPRHAAAPHFVYSRECEI